MNFLLMVLGVFCAQLKADELPKSLQDATAQVESEDGVKAFGVLRRFAYTDKVDERLAARTALAELDCNAGRLDRAATWVADYQNPQPENFAWPRIQAYVEGAKIQFMQGKAFESVKRLTDAKDKTSGLAKIEVERALSWVVEQKPELKQALEYEKSALKTGESYFKRKKISETAGLEPAKPGAEIWKEVKPEIKTRIADLERKIRIDSYGLDFVLYSEAQNYRNASHPLALDFTNVAAAFDQEGEIGGRVPGADYEMAIERYNEILEFFPNNPYGQAAKLYMAVITAKTGDPDGAIKQLKAFYKEDPDGLYRGEALKLMGDLYLFSKWDKVNAQEAYERSVRWVEATKTGTRVLDTYLVPEKSADVSKPPKEVKILTKEGEIKTIPVPKSALANRLTAKWYLDGLRVDLEWRLGFLGIVDDDWDNALEHFKIVKEYDPVIQQAVERHYFNAYDRLQAGKKRSSVIATPNQLDGLSGTERTVVIWADFQFITENFEVAYDLYTKISQRGGDVKNKYAFMRGILGQMLVKREQGTLDRVEDVKMMRELVQQNPNNPSAPFLLEICAAITTGVPFSKQEYYKWIYTKYPTSLFAKRARYFEVIHTELDEIDERKNMTLKFKKDFPADIGYHDSLDRMNEWLIKQYSLQLKINNDIKDENNK